MPTERLATRLSPKARATARLERVLPFVADATEAASLAPSPGDTESDALDKLHGALSSGISSLGSSAAEQEAVAYGGEWHLTSGQGSMVCFESGTVQATQRIAVTARASGSFLRLHFAGLFNSLGSVGAFANSVTLKVGIQLSQAGSPTGSTIPVYFSGARAGVVSPGGVLVSDPVPIKVSAGDKFFVLTFQSGGGTYYANRFTANETGEGWLGSDCVDTPGSLNTPENSVRFRSLQPFLITGRPPTLTKGVAIFGDSLAWGQYDTLKANIGFAASAIGETYPVVNCAVSGSTANNWANSVAFLPCYYALRYCKNAFVEPGINDFAGGASSAQVQSYLTGIYDKVSGLDGARIIGCTIPPRTTSTDFFTTKANQTAVAWNGSRELVNAWIRANANLVGAFDLSAVLSDPTDSSKRFVGPAVQTQSFTADATTSLQKIVDTAASVTYVGQTLIDTTTGVANVITAVTSGPAGYFNYDGWGAGAAVGDVCQVWSTWTADGVHLSGLAQTAAAASLSAVLPTLMA